MQGYSDIYIYVCQDRQMDAEDKIWLTSIRIVKYLEIQLLIFIMIALIEDGKNDD